jgi:signal transduction histidine kinase
MSAIGSPLRRLWPRRVRTRLAVLYATLFLLAGAALLGLTYALLASSLPATANPGKTLAEGHPQQVAICRSKSLTGEPPTPPALQQKCKAAFEAGARAGSANQRDNTLSTMLDVSLIGLAVTTLASGWLGWFVSGRVLRPVRSITEAARRASELQLGERLSLAGPDDELKELADTFDVMLERLDAAFASQQRFVANAAHELRTPLTAMRTAVEVTLSKPGRTPEQLEAMAERVKRSVEQSEAIVEALLALATSELGATAAQPVDLATAAEDALDAAAGTIAERRLSVETSLEPAMVRGDRVLLERLVANLVDNSVRHNHADGSVWVVTRRTNGTAVLEVANTGPAIAEQQLPGLFEPFARGEERLSPGEGVGLGLSIANAIAIAHETAIDARPRAGGGLEVTVRLAG